jgi:hypothetical protein
VYYCVQNMLCKLQSLIVALLQQRQASASLPRLTTALCRRSAVCRLWACSCRSLCTAHSSCEPMYMLPGCRPCGRPGRCYHSPLSLHAIRTPLPVPPCQL